jgi:DNA gyrase subunit A
VSEKGYGKRTDLEDYRITGRGGKGVKTISVTEKTGHLVGLMSVTDEDGLMIICKSGMTIRMAVDKLRIIGRAAQGVKLINIKDKDAIASIAKTPKEEEEEENLEFIGDGTIVEGSDLEVMDAEIENTSDEETENTDDTEDTDETTENTETDE